MFPALTRTARLLPLALLATLLLACTREAPRPVATASATATEESIDALRMRIREAAIRERMLASPTATPSATPAPETTPSTIIPIPSLRPGGVPLTVEALSALRGDITGWFSQPRPPTRIEERAVGPRPVSSLPSLPFSSDSAVLYDTRAGTVRDLGGASTPTFSPDGRLLAWAAVPRPQEVGELVILDLATGQERRLGAARSVRWIDDRIVVVFGQGNDRAHYDVITGQRSAGWPEEQPRLLESYERGGYRIELRWDGDHERTSEYPLLYRTVRVTRLADGATRLFEALEALLTDDGEIVVATMPVPDPAVPGRAGRMGEFTTNIFAVDFASRAATFLATARIDDPDLPLAASRTHVAWRDRGCHPQAQTWVYDRRTDVQTRVSGELDWVIEFTPGNRLALGQFGAKALLDPESLAYTLVLPIKAGDVRWSRDYRYAVAGGYGAHGGYCLHYEGR